MATERASASRCARSAATSLPTTRCCSNTFAGRTPLVGESAARGHITPDIGSRFAWEAAFLVIAASTTFTRLPGGYVGVHLGLPSPASRELRLSAGARAHMSRSATSRAASPTESANRSSFGGTADRHHRGEPPNQCGCKPTRRDRRQPGRHDAQNQLNGSRATWSAKPTVSVSNCSLARASRRPALAAMFETAARPERQRSYPLPAQPPAIIGEARARLARCWLCWRPAERRQSDAGAGCACADGLRASRRCAGRRSGFPPHRTHRAAEVADAWRCRARSKAFNREKPMRRSRAPLDVRAAPRARTLVAGAARVAMYEGAATALKTARRRHQPPVQLMNADVALGGAGGEPRLRRSAEQHERVAVAAERRPRVGRARPPVGRSRPAAALAACRRRIGLHCSAICGRDRRLRAGQRARPGNLGFHRGLGDRHAACATSRPAACPDGRNSRNSAECLNRSP